MEHYYKTLVSEGLARVAYVKEPTTKYLAELEQAQEQAKMSHSESGAYQVM